MPSLTWEGCPLGHHVVGVVGVSGNLILSLIVSDNLLYPGRDTVQLGTESQHLVLISYTLISHLESFLVVVVKHNSRQVSERVDFVGIEVLLGLIYEYVIVDVVIEYDIVVLVAVRDSCPSLSLRDLSDMGSSQSLETGMTYSRSPNVVVTFGPGRIVLLAVVIIVVDGRLKPLDLVGLVGDPHGVGVVPFLELDLGVRGQQRPDLLQSESQ